MSIRYMGEGKAVNYTPDSDIEAKAVVVIGDITGYTREAITAGRRGALHRTGEVMVIKATGEDFMFGDKVYWDVADNNATTDTGTNKQIGVCVEDTEAGAEEVLVIWNY